jgi:prophage regulatory protein
MNRNSVLKRTLVQLRPAFHATGMGVTKGYQQIHDQLFPAPIKLGRQSLVPSDELEEVIAARIAGRSEEQIRALIQRLHAQRQGASA